MSENIIVFQQWSNMSLELLYFLSRLNLNNKKNKNRLRCSLQNNTSNVTSLRNRAILHILMIQLQNLDTL